MGETPSHDKNELVSSEMGRESAAENREEAFDISKFLVEPKNDYAKLIEHASQQSDTYGIYSPHVKEGTLMPLSSDWEEHSSKFVESITGKDNIKDKKVVVEREKAIAFLREKIEGKILIDLGAGWTREMAEFASKYLGAKIYIAVDKFTPNDKEILLNPSRDLSFGRKVLEFNSIGPTVEYKEENGKQISITHGGAAEVKEGKTQLVTIKSDILDFISRLPDDSVCVTINGIDDVAIPSEKYHEALAKEIKRVVAEDGIAFGVNAKSLSMIENGKAYYAEVFEKNKK